MSSSVLMCLLLIMWSCCKSTSSQVLRSIGIWNINVKARLAMPSLVSCFLPIDFFFCLPPPFNKPGGWYGVVVVVVVGGLFSELEHQFSSLRPPPDPGLFTICWFLLRLCSGCRLLKITLGAEKEGQGRKGGGVGGGSISVQQWRTVQSRERDCQ